MPRGNNTYVIYKIEDGKKVCVCLNSNEYTYKILKTFIALSKRNSISGIDCDTKGSVCTILLKHTNKKVDFFSQLNDLFYAISRGHLLLKENYSKFNTRYENYPKYDKNYNPQEMSKYKNAAKGNTFNRIRSNLREDGFTFSLLEQSDSIKLTISGSMEEFKTKLLGTVSNKILRTVFREYDRFGNGYVVNFVERKFKQNEPVASSSSTTGSTTSSSATSSSSTTTINGYPITNRLKRKRKYIVISSNDDDSDSPVQSEKISEPIQSETSSSIPEESESKRVKKGYLMINNLIHNPVSSFSTPIKATTSSSTASSSSTPKKVDDNHNPVLRRSLEQSIIDAYQRNTPELLEILDSISEDVKSRFLENLRKLKENNIPFDFKNYVVYMNDKDGIIWAIKVISNMNL